MEVCHLEEYFLKLKSGLKLVSVDTQFTHFCSFYIDVRNVSLFPFHLLQNSFLAFFFSLWYLPGFLHLHSVNHITNTLDLLDETHTLCLMAVQWQKGNPSGQQSWVTLLIRWFTLCSY